LDEFTDTKASIVEECDDRVVPQLEVRCKGISVAGVAKRVNLFGLKPDFGTNVGILRLEY
jgi:hypothetical protein